MHFPTRALVLSLYLCSASADFVYPAYPAPRDLTSNTSLVAEAWKNLTTTFDAQLKSNQSSATSEADVLAGIENITFSAELFSLNDAGATNLQYHYTAPEIVTGPNGTHSVDGDSIYKCASVSKLITAFAGLLKLSNEDWNRPITAFIPGLVSPDPNDIINDVQWNEITPLALASQLTGIPQVGLPQADQLALSLLSQQPDYGLPPLNISVLGPCALETATTGLICSVDAFIASESLQPPVFQPWTTASYADAPFFLLGLIIANVSGKPILDVYTESIFKPLGMTSSSGSIPTGDAVNQSVIIQGPGQFALDGGFTVPSGGIFTTVNDLSKLGLGILNSTLLSPHRTRKWLKPVAHTASLTYSIGTPWEIIRYIHPSGKVTEIYGKLGDSGSYGGYIAVIPDYNAGFAFLDAASSDSRSPLANVILDQITQNILPALDAQAAAEAKKNFVGTYTCSDKTLNSSVTISFNESTVPTASDSLSISSWISNGTDLLATQIFETAKPRLLPNIFDLKSGKGGRIAFYATGQNQSNSYLGSPFATGPHTGFYYSNFDFGVTGQLLWGGALINELVFDVDDDGKATAVTPSAARVKLDRQA